MEEPIVIQGSVQNAEIIEPKKCTCDNCGNVISIAGSIMFGDRISVLAADTTSISCPKCYALVRL